MIERSLHLIILPSPLIQAATYRHLARRLGSHFHVRILELPESGWNFSAQKYWSAQNYADWVEKLLRKENQSPVILLGHSNSGAIALHLAAVSPDLVQAVVLADTIGVRPQKALRTLLGRALDALIEFKFTLWASFHLLFNLLFHPRNFFFQVRMAIREDLRPVIRRVHVPALILWGQRDHTMPLALSQKLQEMLPQACLFRSPRGSHDWILTNPQEFSDVLTHWLFRSG